MGCKIVDTLIPRWVRISRRRSFPTEIVNMNLNRKQAGKEAKVNLTRTAKAAGLLCSSSSPRHNEILVTQLSTHAAYLCYLDNTPYSNNPNTSDHNRTLYSSFPMVYRVIKVAELIIPYYMLINGSVRLVFHVTEMIKNEYNVYLHQLNGILE